MDEMNSRRAEYKYKIGVTAGGAGVNLALAITKMFIGSATGSVSIMSDSINNFGDVLGCAGAATGFAVEKKQASKKYPYGFGRLEYLVTLIISCIVVIVGGIFAYNSLDRIFYHPLVTFAWVNFGVIAATAVVKLGLGIMFHYTNKKYSSTVLKAEALDSILDSAVTAMTLFGYLLSRYMSFPIDALVGLIISVLIIVSGMRILVSVFTKLLGARDDRRTDGLENLCMDQQGVVKATARVHDYGNKTADAIVELVFESDIDGAARSAAIDNIKQIAAKGGITVAVIEKKEDEQ